MLKSGKKLYCTNCRALLLIAKNDIDTSPEELVKKSDFILVNAEKETEYMVCKCGKRFHFHLRNLDNWQ